MSSLQSAATIWGVAYVLVLAGLAWAARKSSGGRIMGSALDFYTGWANPIGVVVLIFTFSATLFSAFFMVGLPGFIASHGLATWAWVIFGDVVAMAGMYFVAVRVVELAKAAEEPLVSPLQLFCPDRPSRLLFVTLTTVFVMPYLAVQISGFGQLLASATQGGVPLFAASALGLLLIYLYSLVAGIRGIALSDLFQGVLLLICATGLGIALAVSSGGPISLLAAVSERAPQLADRTGSIGLMTLGYLFTGFAVYVALPLTQPQFLSRYLLLAARPMATVRRYMWLVAVGMGTLIGVFGLFVVPIGLHGALAHAGVGGNELLGTILRSDVTPWFGGLFTVGVLAASMSTADSILFALGQIFAVDVYRELTDREMTGDELLVIGKAFVAVVAVVALLVGIANSSLISALALKSFEGTLLLLPTVLFGIWSERRGGPAAVWSMSIGVLVFWLLQGRMTAFPGLSPAIPAVIFGCAPFLLAAWKGPSKLDDEHGPSTPEGSPGSQPAA